ncbi:hypothetical protein [Spirulina subsalsa]|nr:hypothetical protein [Spirulina subsalsa]
MKPTQWLGQLSTIMLVSSSNVLLQRQFALYPWNDKKRISKNRKHLPE